MEKYEGEEDPNVMPISDLLAMPEERSGSPWTFGWSESRDPADPYQLVARSRCITEKDGAHDRKNSSP